MADTAYGFGFITASLLPHQCFRLVEARLEAGGWKGAVELAVSRNILQVRSRTSLKKIAAELISRLRMLHPEEIDLLPVADHANRCRLFWLALCRRHAYVADFAAEVVRENLLSLKGRVTSGDHAAFFNRKAAWRQEMDRISPSTQAKIRQVLFRMLREAGILDDDGAIIPLFPDDVLRPVLARLSPAELAVLPLAGVGGSR